MSSTPSQIKYVADISNVNEVSLLGTADFAYWADQLRPAELEPTPHDGKAQILVIAAQLKFMGLHFNEISFSVLCRSTRKIAAENSHSQVESQDGSFLLRAFNSSRLFAWSERVFFSTPYYYADCRVERNVPASIELIQKGNFCFSAKMNMLRQADRANLAREIIRSGDEGWNGPVFLPDLRTIDVKTENIKLTSPKFFVAKILGPTQVFPFLSEVDKIEISASTDIRFLKKLIDSKFVGREWHIRTDARHAKSKTYNR